jgi:hypothetical protein
VNDRMTSDHPGKGYTKEDALAEKLQAQYDRGELPGQIDRPLPDDLYDDEED